jgi:hypothetical protein
MKRFFIFSGLLFLVFQLFSSYANATTTYSYYDTRSEALSACRQQEAYLDSGDYGTKYNACSYSQVAQFGQFRLNYSSPYAADAMYRWELGSCPAPNEFNDVGECAPPPPPACESPNYIDVVSGECVAPRSVCFTSIHTEENECTYIGGEDPDDPDTPAGCTRNYNTGDLICVSDDVPAGGDADCFTVNGEQICPTPEAVCGNKNGSFQCLEPQLKGCGSFNGENVCVDPTGHVVPVDDPDHPDNGGNLDGDSKNDPTDSRDPVDGGDPDNQPDAPIDTAANEVSTEKTARESNLKLGKIESNTKAAADTLKAMSLNGISTDLSEEVSDSQADSIIQNGATGSWDDPTTGTWAKVDSFTAGIDAGSAGYSGGMVSGITDAATDIIPQGVCSELGFNFKGHGFSLGCDKTERIRDLLSWVFYILTVWFLFDVVTSPTTRQK